MRVPIASRLDARTAIPSIAAAAVLALTLSIWLRAGVTLGEAVRFGVYEAFYVFLPGWVLHELLRPRTASLLRRAVFAFALGQVVAVLAFVLTAGVIGRGLFVVYPLAFLLPVALQRVRRLARTGATDGAPWREWRVGRESMPLWSSALAAVCVLALAYLVLVHFLSAPLPGRVTDFAYEHDYLFHLSLAGEALHHWPLTNPNVAGTPMDYHWFSHIQMAGVAQVTGIPLPTVYFALFPIPLLLLLLCELALSGATLGGRLWAGPIAAFMLIFVGEIDLSMQDAAPFLEVMPTYLRYSPSFLFGAIVFMPLLMTLCEMLQTKQPTWGQWALVAALAVGCSGGEGATLPLIVGGLVGYLAYRRVTDLRVDRRALLALGLTGLILLAAAVVIYGGGSNGLSLTFPGAVEVAPAFAYQLPHVPGGLHGLYWALATLLLIPFLFGATLVGLFWLPRRLSELRAQEVVPLGIFLCGALALAFVSQESGGQEYFAMYGVMAAIPVSAGGLVRLLERWRGARRRSIALALAFAGLCVAASIVMVFNPEAGAAPDVGRRYALPYGILVAVVICLVAWAWRSPAPARGRRFLYPVIVVLAAAVVNVPTDYHSRLGRLLPNETAQVEEGPGLTPSLYEGLQWIEDNTSTDAVLAVDNLRTPETRRFAPLYFYVAAFAERRTLLQGWEYTARATRLGFTAVGELRIQPFPYRLRLEDKVFDDASRSALDRLRRRYGVTNLVVDRSNGRATQRLSEIARLVYVNPAIEVYSVGNP